VAPQFHLLVDMRSISRRLCMLAEDRPHVRDGICFFFEIVWGCRQPVYRVLLTIEAVERAVMEQPVAIRDHNHDGLVPGSSCDILEVSFYAQSDYHSKRRSRVASCFCNIKLSITDLLACLHSQTRLYLGHSVRILLNVF
jgi:hypothetical protein